MWLGINHSIYHVFLCPQWLVQRWTYDLNWSNHNKSGALFRSYWKRLCLLSCTLTWGNVRLELPLQSHHSEGAAGSLGLNGGWEWRRNMKQQSRDRRKLRPNDMVETLNSALPEASPALGPEPVSAVFVLSPFEFGSMSLDTKKELIQTTIVIMQRQWGEANENFMGREKWYSILRL